ncbi:MAG: hypothetical protein DHS20C15_11470 [Planctomycetota bacterium]|nr:MAG: hypothetical protein DHS20C15_11470 [Planctomycetota bacterium]
MISRARSTAILVAAALLAPVTAAQDSVQITACGPGDSVGPWDDTASGLFGSEQTNDYVVDLQSFTGSWGTPFGIAPLAKASKSSSGFTSSVISAQAISRRQQVGVPTLRSSYAAWSAPGFGVNNNPAINTAPSSVSTAVPTNQFTVAFNEGGQTDFASFYDGVVGVTVNFVPSSPGRLFVSRTLAASNSCTPVANMGSMGLGSADEDGNIFIRYDDFGAVGGCGALPVAGATNILSVDTTARTSSVQNVFSGVPMTFADAAATSTYIYGAATAHSTPNGIPESIAGAPTFGAITFASTYASGTAGSTSAVGTHLNAAVGDSRGSLGYMSASFAPLSATAGVYGHIGVSNSSGDADELNIFGVDASGMVTGTTHATLPASITDPKDGFTTFTDPGGEAEFDHYHSQTAFQGGNGQVALGTDQDGNMLVAAVFDHPIDGGSTHPINAVGVGKFDGSTGAFLGWTLAGHNNGVGGKDVLDGPGGTALYEMVTLSAVTGGAVIGPSVSSPMIDSVGNVYFLTALREIATGDFSSGVVRAVYDKAAFGYELELLFQTGDVFRGKNSDRDYLISYMEIADANSISSEAPFSGNISEVAHGSQDPSGLDTRDPRTLGGLVINASIIYDTNDDGDFTTCFNSGVDEQYNVVLYVGHREWEDVGFGKPRDTLEQPELHISGSMVPGAPTEFGFTNAAPGESAYVIIGFGPLFAPFKCMGTMVPTVDAILGPFPTLAGSLQITPAWPAGIPAGIPLHWQVHFTGPSICAGIPSTNGVRSVTY